MAKVDVRTEFRFSNFDLQMLITEAPFDQAKMVIEEVGGELATTLQIAYARIIAGPEHHVSTCGSLTAENFVYYPNGKILVTSAEYSPILKQPKKATQAFREDKEYHLSKKVASTLEKIAKADKRKLPVKQRIYTLDVNDDYEIPVSKFEENKVMQFLFKGAAPDYAKFLQEKTNLKEVPVAVHNLNCIKRRKKPFARALWFNNLDDTDEEEEFSGISDSGYLNYNHEVRGVHINKSTEKIIRDTLKLHKKDKNLVDKLILYCLGRDF